MFTRRWHVFKAGSGIDDTSAPSQLFQCASKELGDNLLKSDADVASRPLTDLLTSMRRLAVIPIATGVLRTDLMQMCQRRDEAFRSFAARVRGKADTCAFSADCQCGQKVDYTDHMIRDTLLKGICDVEIRREVLGTANILTTAINDVIALVESKEMARNAAPISDVSAVSAFKRQKTAPVAHDGSEKSPCPVCKQLFSLYSKGPRGWNSTPHTLCIDCFRSRRRKKHHNQASPTSAAIQNERSHLPVNNDSHLGEILPTNSSTESNDAEDNHHALVNDQWVKANMREHPTISVNISMDQAWCRSKHPPPIAKNVVAIADTGAQTNVWSLREFLAAGFERSILLPAPNLVAANHSRISIDGAFFGVIQGNSRDGQRVQCHAMIYISSDVSTLYLSQETLADLGVLSPCFPSIGEHRVSDEDNNTPCPSQNPTRSLTGGCASVSHQTEPCTCPQRTAVPPLPQALPFPCTPDNNPKMREWLLKRYAASTFNTCPHRALHCMTGPPIEIHVDPHAKPVACHTPAPIPLHWQEKVREDLLRDEALGILEKVPHGDPTTWCHRMVITRKHDGTPRRTVDLSPLNKFCKRETFASEAPFHLARRVPRNTWKTVTDAWNGYHSVPLRESDRHLTTFITPFGKWRYTRAPQGFLSSGDGYNRRFNSILADFVRKERCVDDTVFYDDDLSQHWWRTMEFLTLVGQSGIVLNPEKFQFANRSVDFAGFRISESTVEPLPKYLNAIRDFPAPKNITDVRSWFGLVNQVASYAQLRDLVAPFKQFLSPKRKFEWSDELDRAFAASKLAIIDAIRHGVEIFDPTRRTCLRPDWSNRGIGYFLLQKHCSCDSCIPDCCEFGWRVTLAGSRSLSSAERRYAPVEGEALAVAWGLEQTKYFTQGCDNLVVVTDHKPLTKIFGDRTLDEITNTRLFRLKQRTLLWRFQIFHLPGATNCAADATSRHPVLCTFIATVSCHELDSPDIIEQALVAAVQHDSSKAFSIQWEEIALHTKNDPALNHLLHAIECGFDSDSLKTHCVGLDQYLPFRESYYILDGVILYNDRVVVPASLRHIVLSALHAAHQGTSAMERRARATVFWPGMTRDIHDVRNSCAHCNRNAPSQAAPPPMPAHPPATPFEQVFADYFNYGGRNFLVIGDKFSGWADVFGTSTGSSISGAAALVRLLRSYFGVFGVPDEISTDGGPEFTASATETFLKTWGVNHRVSSAYFPQSNGRAEVAVKSAKRMLRDNVSPDGDLNNDSFLRALLQLRNTPDPDCGMSPAEVVFGRPLRDAFSFVNRLAKYSNHFVRRTWRETWKAKEDALRLRAGRNAVALKRNSHPLPALNCGDRVFIQNQAGNYPLKWDKVGTIMEVLTFDRYVVKVCGSGRLTTRNRRFLRLVPTNQARSSSPNACEKPTSNMPPLLPDTAPGPSPIPPASNYHHSSVFSDPVQGSCPEPSTELASDHSPPADTDEPPMELPVENPSLRRSTRARRPALELDPASGRWIPKGLISSMGWGNKLGGM